MATVSVVVQTNKTGSTFVSPGQPHANQVRVINLLKGLLLGALQGSVNVYADASDPVQASATATIATAVAGNSITIGGTTITASAAPATESDFLVTGTDTVVAAAVAACVNAHSVISKIASATSAANVVTISCTVPGVIGNQVPVAKVGVPITLSSAALVGGAGGVSNAPVRGR